MRIQPSDRQTWKKEKKKWDFVAPTALEFEIMCLRTRREEIGKKMSLLNSLDQSIRVNIGKEIDFSISLWSKTQKSI